MYNIGIYIYMYIYIYIYSSTYQDPLFIICLVLPIPKAFPLCTLPRLLGFWV